MRNFSCLLLLVCLLFPHPLTAQLVESRIVPDDGEEAEYFGWTTAVYGDYALIGASEDDDLGPAAGSAYIFKRSGDKWVQHQKLLASDGSSYDTFGGAVALSATYAVIGARLDDDRGLDAGAVYVFVLQGDTWVEQAKLTAADGAPVDHFGSSVGIAGNIIVAGASLDDDNGENSGSAYVFRNGSGGWTQEAKLLASDGSIDDRFEEVAISDSTIIIGAWGDQDQGALTGSAYIFVSSGSGWSQQAKLIASDQAGGDQFGLDVSISGDRAIIGAYGNDDRGENSGSAYVFLRVDNTWTEEIKLLANDGAFYDEFGISVCINGDYAVVGADVDDDNGENSGSAYLFQLCNGSWDRLSKLTASDGEPYDYFGISVALDDRQLIIGAGGDDENGPDAGAAYLFEGFALAPEAPQLVAPLNGAVIAGDISLVWAPVFEGTDRYWVEWSTDPLFSDAQQDSMLTDITYSVSGLEEGMSYWWRVRAHNMAGWGAFSESWSFSVAIVNSTEGESEPLAFRLHQNYPNPFNPRTEIGYGIPETGFVSLKIYDALGREVVTLVDQTQAPGSYEVSWEASGQPSGVYYYRLASGNSVETRRLLLLR